MDDLTKEKYGFGKAKVKKTYTKHVPTIVKQIQKQTLQGFDYTSQKHISYSQFSTYEQCNHKWELHYKNKLYNSQQSINLVFGTSIHETIQHYINTIYNTSGAEADRLDIEEYFETRYRENYLKAYKDNDKVHFSNSDEMGEFYEDGLEIIRFIKKNRKNYFGKRGTYLVGCEIPILIKPNTKFQNTFFKGFIDVVFYNEITGIFKIIDIKTSTKSWGDYQKKDKLKQFQLVLYKQFFSEQFKIPLDDIKIEFFIVKRKIWEEAEFAAAKRRVQEFIPSSGKNSISKAVKTMNDFIENVFNEDGTHKDKTYEPNPNPYCQNCPYNSPGLCKKNDEFK